MPALKLLIKIKKKSFEFILPNNGLRSLFQIVLPVLFN